MLPSQSNTGDAKPWLHPIFRKRRFFIITTTIFATTFYLCLGGRIRAPNAILQKLGLHNEVLAEVEYSNVNASLLTYPPNDPRYILLEVPPQREALSQNIPLVTDAEVASPDSSKLLHESCLDIHFAKGLPCYAELDPPLDVVWTWVNGSDKRLMESMSETVRKTNPKMPTASRPDTGLYRDHDELRHSVRSVLKHFRGSTRKLHIVTSDFPLFLGVKQEDGTVSVDQRRLGLVPSWLDLETAPYWQDGDVSLEMKFHAQIFKIYETASFNSLAIESQLANLDLSDTFIYMNDDVYMMADLTASDFYTSSYGIVLRMQADLLVSSVQNPKGIATGEWIALEFTNYNLGKRFGNRKRPYNAHTAKTFSTSLWKEFATIWQKELDITSTHPFRGMKDGGQPDIYMGFLFTHSIVERWREGLLWSWAVAKHGGLNDEWDDEAKARAWEDLGGKPGEKELVVKVTPRTSSDPDIVDWTLREAGHTPSGKTKYSFVSSDGYPYGYFDQRRKGTWPKFLPDGHDEGDLCTLNFDKCFNWPGTDSASGFFKHIAFEENIACGDCIIDALRSASGEAGISAYLPDPSRVFSHPLRMEKDTDDFVGIHITSDDTPKEAPHLPLVSDWKQGDFTLQGVLPQESMELNIRQWTLRLLERYRFVIGDTPSRFHLITSATSAASELARVDKDENVALLCLNDNVRQSVQKAHNIMVFWQEQRWKEKAAWERKR